MNAIFSACVMGFIALQGLSTAAAQDLAQAYPSRPVTIIIVVTPGGSAEAQARIYTPKLQESLGKPFIFDYKPGAGGTIGFAAAARSTPDGYTLLATTPAFSTVPALMKLSYDPIKDFAPVALLGKQLGLLVVHPSVPVNNIQEYVAYVRAHPGELNYGTTGAGSTPHLAGAWLNELTHTQTTFIHYKGSQLQTDLMAGNVQVTAGSFVNIAPLVKAGKLRGLAIAGSMRSPLFPDMKTAQEQGVDFEVPFWMGILTPAGTSSPIIGKLNSEFLRIQKLPDTQRLLERENVIPVSGSPSEFRRLIIEEIDRWKRLVKQTGMKLEGE